ncbi:MAG TPA: SDR family NAD(P)-dependent oxidoreductase [Myxococcota bacterium]|nr:SDR family NAD(P)-dependent oxidoreductase [Myxococcota bacterium]
MERLAGRVAVVTGAASGIGRALARRLGAEGMQVVLADVEAGALAEAERELGAAGVETLAVRTDVTDEASVRALADAALARFGAVHLVCNNAGVMGGAGLCWEVPPEDWAWVLGVNLQGVIHGIRVFVPILLAQEEGHVLNTASMAALVSLPLASPYVVSKHAVLALSESLFHELAGRGPHVGVSVLCPEAVDTRIVDAERNRPEALRPARMLETPERKLVDEATRKALAGATAPDAIAERAVRGIREGRFYILAEDAWRRTAELRCEDIRLARNPTLAPPV